MGHMKKVIGLWLMVYGLCFMAGKVLAHEGIVDLTGGDVSCKGVSIYKDGHYNVSGRCDGLVYPYETTYNKYVLWGKTTTGGTMTRIAEVDRGYFSGNIASAFDAMYITAEQNSLTRKASMNQIVSGRVTPFDFDKSKVTTVPETTTAITNKTTSVTTTPSNATTGTVVGKIVSSLLVVILVVVAIAIGASLLFRNRGSVSA